MAARVFFSCAATALISVSLVAAQSQGLTMTLNGSVNVKPTQMQLDTLKQFQQQLVQVVHQQVGLSCQELPNCTQECQDGLIIPAWRPLPFVNGTQQIGTGPLIGRAAVYLFALFYLFLGISIISDRFMSAIEVITSQERTVIVRGPDGHQHPVQVRIWNETVSNLTLMALGSSCPEILLSIIEICGNGFEAGELGPGTIVGSAAYNLFVITGLCTLVVGDAPKRIKHLRVFFITASWSVFAYVWMFAILAWISPGVIDVWEAALTFLFFPITVLSAWVVDRRLLFGKLFGKRVGLPGGPAAFPSPKHEAEADGDHHDSVHPMLTTQVAVQPDHEMDDAFYEFERHRTEYIELLKQLRKKHPGMPKEKLEEQAQFEVLNRGPKSRAFYRIQATRNLTGGGNVLKMSKIEKKLLRAEEKQTAATSHIQKVLFEPAHHTVLENIGTFNVTVARRDGDLSCELMVDYVSEDGTATGGEDYMAVQGTLEFAAGETQKQIPVTIVDDDEFEEDEHFYIKLLNLRIRDPLTGQFVPANVDVHQVQLATPAICTVMILDDDHPGVFQFGQPEFTFSEACGHAELTVSRLTGARGRVFVPYRTVDGSSHNGVGYHEVKGELVFENDQTQAVIRVPITNEEKYEKSESFTIELGVPSYQCVLVSNHAEAPGESASPHAVAASASHGSIASSSSPSRQSQSQNHHRHSHVEYNDRFFASFSEQVRSQPVNSDQPRLGDHVTVKVMISESAEFKSVIDVLMKKANTRMLVGTSSWIEQFKEAVTISAGDDEEGEDEEDEPDTAGEIDGHANGVAETRLVVEPSGNGAKKHDADADADSTSEKKKKEKKKPSFFEYVMHYSSLLWKLLFAFVPPTDYLNGWLCFCVSIIIIGLLTAVVGDVASHFGCTVGLKDAVTAITFVALGTSLPDTFASKVAAMHDEFADSSIGNVTGSNAVNVFLGIGAAWLVAAIYHAANGAQLRVKAGSLGFSVTLFCILAVICISVLLLRRSKRVGGELGGPKVIRYLTASFMFSLWVIYIVFSSLQYYGHITGF